MAFGYTERQFPFPSSRDWEQCELWPRADFSLELDGGPDVPLPLWNPVLCPLLSHLSCIDRDLPGPCLSVFCLLRPGDWDHCGQPLCLGQLGLTCAYAGLSQSFLPMGVAMWPTLSSDVAPSPSSPCPAEPTSQANLSPAPRLCVQGPVPPNCSLRLHSPLHLASVPFLATTRDITPEHTSDYIRPCAQTFSTFPG